MSDDKILKGVVRGMAQLGMETIETASEEGGRIVESILTGKELLGLERTMSDTQLEQRKEQEKIKSQQEINKLKEEMGGKGGEEDSKKKVKERPRNVEEEMIQLRRQQGKQEEEKAKYYEEQREKRENQIKLVQTEYNDLGIESTNPSKQKKNRGSAFANKKKHKPDTSQTSATQEYKGGGKID